MTRLFLRFYFGVLVILFFAWLINTYVWRDIAPEANVSVIEDALSGGVYVVRDRFVQAGEHDWDDVLEKTRREFKYPIRMVPPEQRPMDDSMRARIDSGEAVLYGDRMIVALPDSTMLLEFGPLPAFSGPSQTDLMIGLGAVFVITAFAIAILLRPVAMQLRAVERAAQAIAQGDLSARIRGARLTRNLPLAVAFNSMADRIESLLRSQRELLQAVSHELRTPLARIKFATELLRGDMESSQGEERIEAIDDATDQLDSLVGELLTYVRQDANGSAQQQERVDSEEMIEDLLQIYAPLSPQIQFRSDVPDPPPPIYGHRTGLYRAVGNLIANAGKHARSQVMIKVDANGQTVTISVDDDGEGIPESDRELIFEPFQRRPDDPSPGHGLGLALVRRICQRHKGDVDVSTSPLGGARFVIHWPVETAQESSGAA